MEGANGPLKGFAFQSTEEVTMMLNSAPYHIRWIFTTKQLPHIFHPPVIYSLYKNPTVGFSKPHITDLICPFFTTALYFVLHLTLRSWSAARCENWVQLGKMYFCILSQILINFREQRGGKGSRRRCNSFPSSCWWDWVEPSLQDPEDWDQTQVQIKTSPQPKASLAS